MLARADANSSRPETAVRITDAARLCFRRQGFRRTTVDDVAREAGISRRTYYRYFKSLEEVMARVAEIETRRALLEAREVAKEAEGFPQKLVALVFHMTSRPAEWVQELGLEEDIRATTNLVYLASPDFVERVGDVLYPILEEGRSSGELRSDLTFSEVVDWLLGHFWSLRYVPRGQRSLQSLHDHIARLVVPALLQTRPGSTG